MKAKVLTQAFISGAGMLHRPHHGLFSLPATTTTTTTITPSFIRPSSSSRSSSNALKMSLHPDPTLLTQLAGCAVLVGSGKALQLSGWEEEHENDLKPW